MPLEEIASCPICNSQNFKSFLTCSDHTTTGERFTIKECNNCNFLITSPRPIKSEIGRYYQSDKYISHTGQSKSMVDKIYLVARNYSLKRKRKLVSTYSLSGTLMDYGCGTGEFLNECYKHGWKIDGVEPSSDARKKSEQLINQKIHSDLTQLSDNQFDVITLWHVIEHIHDLNETVKRLTDLLKKDGTIIIAVPNPESWDAKKYATYWAAYDLPRHLWHFSKNNMTSLFKNHGLKIVGIKPMLLDSFYVSLLSEQYKNPEQNLLMRFIAGIVSGLTSNIKASANTNHSSLIYIAKK